jgi:hypothetical protein
VQHALQGHLAVAGRDSGDVGGHGRSDRGAVVRGPRHAARAEQVRAARRRSPRQCASPDGAKPKARWNRRWRAASLTGRSPNAGLTRISRAVPGWLDTTRRVRPTEKDISAAPPSTARDSAASVLCATGLESAVTTPGGPDGGRRLRESAHAGPPGESHRRTATRTRAARRGGRGEVVGRRSRRRKSSWPVVMVSTMAGSWCVGDAWSGEMQ